MKICFGFKQQPWWAKKQWRNCGPPCIYIFFQLQHGLSLSCTMSEAGLLLPLTFKKDPSLFAHSHSNIFFLLFSQELLLLVAFLQTHAPDSKEKNSFVSLKKSTSNNFFHHKFPSFAAPENCNAILLVFTIFFFFLNEKIRGVGKFFQEASSPHFLLCPRVASKKRRELQ